MGEEKAGSAAVADATADDVRKELAKLLAETG
jgi:hypothetical protein